MKMACVLVTGFLLVSNIASAEIPQMITYQGKVTDAGGDPVADGNYIMRFMICDAATGGSVLWDSGDLAVAVAQGVFSNLLGESPQPAITLDFDLEYWLEVIVEGDTQTPRVRLGSVGYSYMASGLVPGTEVVGLVTTGTEAAIKGTNTATRGPGYGVYGQTLSSEGQGVFGSATASTGDTRGVLGESTSSEGIGVFGIATATSGATCGVRGLSASDDGFGVYGLVTATHNYNYGVFGESNSSNGYGVYGRAAEGLAGVYGEGASFGVEGHATATIGSPMGGRFESQGPYGFGVYGFAGATTGEARGGQFLSHAEDGRGVYAEAVGTGTAYGVYATTTFSDDGRGVFGLSNSATGDGQGVRGESKSSTNGVGVYGLGSSTYGLNYGVFGRTLSTGGFGVYYAGGLAGSGTKSCVVRTSLGPVLMYCQESPENWFEDVGRGCLVDGRCHIELDPLFLETVRIDSEHPMEVFVQLRDNCRGVYVKAASTGFDVIELQDGGSNAEFSYRVMAKRKGFEEKRLDYCKAGEKDPYLFPELRDEELRKLEAEHARYEMEQARPRDEFTRIERDRARATLPDSVEVYELVTE